MYLEPIFGSEDIVRQLPTEARRFQSVDTLWRKTMGDTNTDPNFMSQADEEKHLDEKFKKANEKLDEVLTHSLAYSLANLLTHSLAYSLTHSLTHLFTYSLTHQLTPSLAYSLTHSPIHLLPHSLTHLLTHLLTHSPTHSCT